MRTLTVVALLAAFTAGCADQPSVPATEVVAVRQRAAPSGDPLPFKSDSASFRARFPAEPGPDAKELRVGAERTIPVSTYRAADPKTGAVFSVTVAEYPPAFAEVPADV